MQHKDTIVTKRTLKGKLQSKDKQSPNQRAQNIKKKEKREPSPTPMHQMAPRDIQPQSQEPKQRRTPPPHRPLDPPPPHRPLDPPPPTCDATDAIAQDNEKANAQYPRSLPNLPKTAHAPRTQQRTPVQPLNLTATASKTRIISLRSNAKNNPFLTISRVYHQSLLK